MKISSKHGNRNKTRNYSLSSTQRLSKTTQEVLNKAAPYLKKSNTLILESQGRVERVRHAQRHIEINNASQSTMRLSSSV